MPTFKVLLEYHGGGFSGWAVQPGLRTVEGTLSEALAAVLGAAPSLSVAGRTDAGVHARRQVVSFGADAEAQPLARSLNGVLPQDVAVVTVEQAPDGFDARRDARSRTYCYRMLTRAAPSPFERDRMLWWPDPLDEAALARCATALHGTHDFTAFTRTQNEHMRFARDVARAEWLRDGPVLEFWIEADSFMRHMVRVLVGTMLEVGAGRRDVSSFTHLLAGAERASAGPTAQPHGLCLENVSY